MKIYVFDDVTSNKENMLHRVKDIQNHISYLIDDGKKNAHDVK